MSHNENDLLFSEEVPENNKALSTEEQWTILIVDDEKDVHEVTRLSFHGFQFQNKSIHFINAYSAEEAKFLIKENPSISIVLLDVVMEEDTSGLKFVKYIRNELNNKLIRIIIRTGQPGIAPEQRVIIDYDINDYTEKTELTKNKLFSAVIMALRSYRDLVEIEKAKIGIEKLLVATNQFVPHHFLNILNKKDITEVSLGEYVELDLTVLFLDVRSFTKISEKLSASGIFNYINTMLQIVTPEIVGHDGFIDKYIGDSIMALFSETDAAIKASINMLKTLDAYNVAISNTNKQRIHVGISINCGRMALGTVGYHDRMDCTVISSVVNTAAKLEKMNKELGTRLLVTADLFKSIEHAKEYQFRELGDLIILGKTIPIEIIEILDAEPDHIKNLKIETKPLFEKALKSFKEKNYRIASDYFKQILEINHEDKVVEYFIKKCLVLEKGGA